jgi:hypothetical protein
VKRSALMAAHATMDKIMTSSVFYAVRAEMLYAGHNLVEKRLITADRQADDRPVLSSEREPHIKSVQLSDSNKHLVLNRRWVLDTNTDWQTDRRS